MPEKPTYEQLEQRILELEEADFKRKLAEETLQRSEMLLKETQIISKMGGWEYDVQTNVSTFTDMIFAIYGETFSDPKEGIKFYHIDDRMVVMQSFENAIAKNEPYDIEVRFINAQGDNLWVRTIGKPVVEDGKVVKIIGNLMDITDRKQAEEALRSEKLTSDMYINSLPGLFYVFDDQRFVRWNNVWNRITGYSDEELAGKYCMDFFEGEDKMLIEEKMLKVFRKGISEAEANLVTKDGRRIPYYFTGVRKQLNGKDHLIGLGIDITDRKRAEEEIKEKEKLQGIVEIVGTVCHELSQPMHIISGYSEVLAMDGLEDDPKLKKLKKIKAQVERMAKLLEKLSTITRYKTKAHDSKTKIIDLESSTERRHNMRFMPLKHTIVTSKSDYSIEGQLFDISKNGLSFWCDKCGDPKDELIKLNIHIAEGNFNIDNIRCIIVCDSELKSDEKLNSRKMNRCRIKFEKLTKEQNKKIENFIQNHTNSNAD